MAYFFIGTNSYSLGQKTHISRFFLSFHNEMFIVICAIFAITIKNLSWNLSLKWNNQKLPFEKNIVRFKLTS